MTRKAMLVHAANAGTAPLAGAPKDISNWKNFMLSAAGGAWFDHEIIVLEDPTTSLLLSELGQVPSVDYFFFAFAGHGYSQHGINYIELSDNSLAVSQVVTKNDRESIVIDACRVHVDTGSALLGELNERMLKFSADRNQARAQFDLGVSHSSSVRSEYYSCSDNEMANENNHGGFYTQQMIRAGQENRPTSIMDAHRLASSRVTLMNQSQHPDASISRSVRAFPPLSVRA